MDHIVAEIVVQAELLRDVIDVLLRLEGPLRPHSVSAGEDELSVELDQLDGRRLFLDSISSNLSFLFLAPRGTFMFCPQPEGWRVYVSDIVEKDAVALMQIIAQSRVQFAFAAEREELIFLNQTDLLYTYGEVQAWVGRDARRYLPGIYWITVVPVLRVVDWNGLMALASSVEGMTVRPGHHNLCIQLHERAADWRDRALANRTAGLLKGPVFDKADVLKQIDGTEDFLTLSEKLDEWP